MHMARVTSGQHNNVLSIFSPCHGWLKVGLQEEPKVLGQDESTLKVTATP